MRYIKSTAAVALAATVLTLAPAAASLARPLFGRHGNARTPGGCRVTLQVAERLIDAGETAYAWGRFSCQPKGEDQGQTVTLYERSVGAPGYTPVGTTTTGPGGFYGLGIGALTSNTQFYAAVDGVSSRVRMVRVTSAVTLTGPGEGADLPATISTGRPDRVTFSGTVNPDDAGALVVLQRQNALTGNEWRRIGRTRVVADGAIGTFTIRHVFIVPGDANIRVLIRSQGRNVASPSNTLNYEISQAQNPHLTIAGSPDPIRYGQPVTVSGKGEVPNTPVTLLARTAHQSGYAAVAQTKANGSGEYAFAPQYPVYSTFYEVQGGGQTSAVLFEGVGELLNVSLSPGTTIEAGQTLTFSGSVSPAHAGHVIYLERENPNNSQFHVVQVSTISPSSTFSIAHAVYKVGTSVFRVRIPGDPANGGAVSQTFTVTVNPPASPASLTPESPGNSTLPAEGQT